MELRYATRVRKKILWTKAKRVGFTIESLRRMLVLLNLDPRTMTADDFTNLMPYVNEINAKKFNY